MRRYIASAAVAIALVSACAPHSASKSSPQATRSLTPSSGAAAWPSPTAPRVQLGSVSELAVSSQAIFALYTPTGTQGKLVGAVNTMLARIDRTLGAVVKAGPFPGALRLALGAGSVWLGGGNEFPGPPYPGAIGIVRLDPVTLKRLASVALPAESSQRALVAEIAGTADQVWMAYGTQLYTIDPKTAGVQVKESLAGIATSIAIDSSTDRLYVGSDASANQTDTEITEWDLATLRKLAASSTGGAGLGGPQVAAAGNEIWVAFATGMLGQVEHRRASDLRVLPIAQHQYTNSVNVYLAGGFVWTTDGMANQVACLDPVTGAIRASTALNLGGEVAGDSQGLYVGEVDGLDSLIPDPRCARAQ